MDIQPFEKKEIHLHFGSNFPSLGEFTGSVSFARVDDWNPGDPKVSPFSAYGHGIPWYFSPSPSYYNS